MKNHHTSEAGVRFEIQFGLWIKIWAGEHIFFFFFFLHMAANYRLKITILNVFLSRGENIHGIASAGIIVTMYLPRGMANQIHCYMTGLVNHNLFPRDVTPPREHTHPSLELLKLLNK